MKYSKNIKNENLKTISFFCHSYGGSLVINTLVQILQNDPELLEKAKLTEQELLLEIALIFFQRKVFTLGTASEFSRIHQYEFQKILAKRKIPLALFNN